MEDVKVPDTIDDFLGTVFCGVSLPLKFNHKFVQIINGHGAWF